MKFNNKLWKIGDSLVVTIPPAILEKLQLKAGDIREFDIEEE